MKAVQLNWTDFQARKLLNRRIGAIQNQNDNSKNANTQQPQPKEQQPSNKQYLLNKLLQSKNWLCVDFQKIKILDEGGSELTANISERRSDDVASEAGTYVIGMFIDNLIKMWKVLFLLLNFDNWKDEMELNVKNLNRLSGFFSTENTKKSSLLGMFSDFGDFWRQTNFRHFISADSELEKAESNRRELGRVDRDERQLEWGGRGQGEDSTAYGQRRNARWVGTTQANGWCY